MQISTRNIPQIDEEIKLNPKAADSSPAEAEILVNTSYEALSRLETLVSKGNRRSMLAMGLTIGTGAIMMAMMAANLGKTNQSFIANGNGEVQKLEFYAGDSRSDALIQSFAGRFVSNLYTWRSTLPETGNPLDKGISEGGEIVPSSVYKATLGMEPKFGEKFRREIGKLIAHNLKDSDFQAVYIPREVDAVKKAGSGIWKIRVVGTQQILGKEKKQKPIWVELTVRAVPPPTIKSSDKQQPNSLAIAVAAARAEGLEVTNIAEVKD